MVMAAQFIDPLFNSFYYMQYVGEPQYGATVVDAFP